MTATLVGHESLSLKLKNQVAEVKRGSGDVIVGFVRPYAALVHETHKTLPKFLENAFREELNSGRAIKTIQQEFKKDRNIQNGLLIVGERIKEGAQENTPVKTGALVASAYVSTELGQQNAEFQANRRAEAAVKEFQRRQQSRTKRKR